MSKSKTDATRSRTAVGKPGAGTGSRTRADGSRTTDGITITRWNLGLSLSIALTVVAGSFSLLWERTNALQETQIELVGRVSRLEVQVAELREDVDELRLEIRGVREEMSQFRDEMREEMSQFREEMREEMRQFREEMRDLLRDRETSGAGAE